jgi:peroxiredoxin
MSTIALTPRQPVPALIVPLVNAEQFDLRAQAAEKFDLVVFYRGLHCPICAKYLTELDALVPEFKKRGVQAVALSNRLPSQAP